MEGRPLTLIYIWLTFAVGVEYVKANNTPTPKPTLHRRQNASHMHITERLTKRRQLIFNGEESHADEYPFGAILCSTIHTRKIESFSGDKTCHPICSGSLISPGVVLTAAHCLSDFAKIYEYDNNYTDHKGFENLVLDSYRVLFGRNESGPHGISTSVKLKKVIVGEPFVFTRGSAVWDIALLFLDTCQTEYETVKLLKGKQEGPIKYNMIPEHLQIIGWGDSEPFCVRSPMNGKKDGFDPLSLMDYNVIDCNTDRVCKLFPSRCDDAMMLCMRQTNTASCTGDSGGPIFAAVNRTRPLVTHGTGTSVSSDLTNERYKVLPNMRSRTSHEHWINLLAKMHMNSSEEPLDSNAKLKVDRALGKNSAFMHLGGTVIYPTKSAPNPPKAKDWRELIPTFPNKTSDNVTQIGSPNPISKVEKKAKEAESKSPPKLAKDVDDGGVVILELGNNTEALGVRKPTWTWLIPDSAHNNMQEQKKHEKLPQTKTQDTKGKDIENGKSMDDGDEKTFSWIKIEPSDNESNPKGNMPIAIVDKFDRPDYTMDDFINLNLTGGLTDNDSTADAQAATDGDVIYVQVAILSGGEILPNEPLDLEKNRGRMHLPINPNNFVDHATGAFLPSYTSWLKKHLKTDSCLSSANLSVDDIFIDESIFE